MENNTAVNEVFKDEEYSTQYFGFTAKSFTDGVYNAVSDELHDLMKIIQQVLITQYGNVIPETEINEAMIKILNRIIDKANISADKLEEFLRSNVFCIPDCLVLPEDHCTHRNELVKHDEEILRLTQKIQKILLVNSSLRQESKLLDELISQHSIALNKLQSDQVSSKENGVTNWHEILSFNVQKSVSLQNLILKWTDIVEEKTKISPTEI